jgi:hypothetical protein
MKQHAAWKKTAIYGILAAALGLIGFVPLFSDSPAAWISIVAVVVVFFFSGLVIGYAHPQRWWISGLTTWSGVLFATASLLTPLRFHDAQTLQIFITDGKIVVSRSVLVRGDVRLELMNSGTTIHTIGIFHVGADGSLEQLRQGRFRRQDLRASLRPLSPGRSDVSYFRDYFPAGRYALVCLVETHAALGEVAAFSVE